MRNIFICLFISLLSVTLLVNEVSAKRFGGGRSFGVQRSQSSLSRSYNPQSTAFAQRSNPSRWGGVLGGLLIGGLLATLFMGNGFAKGLLTWLVLGAVILFIMNWVRRMKQPGFQTMHANPQRQTNFSPFTKPFTEPSSNGNFADFPAHFDADAFIREAKVTFIRLQAAYDEKNIMDLKQFTAPEVFGEIKMQLDERGDEPNKTDVLNLEAELLDVSKQAISMIASVRFTGYIKENEDPMSPLDEIWHFSQLSPSGPWVVVGIQQDIVQP